MTSTVQIFTSHENRCNLHIDDADTVLRNVALSVQFKDNVVTADEVQRVVEVLLAQQKSFSGNLNYGSKIRLSSPVVIAISDTSS